jgi:hypothetical protein
MELADALRKMPKELAVSGRREVYVVHNGAQLVESLTGDIQKMVVEETTNQIRRVFKDKLPDAGITV